MEGQFKPITVMRYDLLQQELCLEFQSGRIAVFYRVPRVTHAAFAAADDPNRMRSSHA